MIKKSLFYHNKPLFGLDIGSQTIKFMQLDSHHRRAIVRAYGSIATDDKVLSDGVVNETDLAAQLIDQLLDKNSVGNLTTNRVAMAVPVSRIYTRVVSLPFMSKKDFAKAVKLEIEESIPTPSKDLYYDYELSEIKDSDQLSVRMVAVPKKIIDSYVTVCDLLGLDLALVQTNIKADSQLCTKYEHLSNEAPYIIVDVGGNSIDIGIIDGSLRVTGTISEGGNSLTQAISKQLKIPHDKANNIKIKNGIVASKYQDGVMNAVQPILNKLIKEIKRMIKFYQSQSNNLTEVSQVLIVGGGSNMPGFGDYITNELRTPSRVVSPWDGSINFGKLEPPEHANLPRFLTCCGLALASDEEALAL